LTEECHKIIKAIKQMESSLDDPKSNADHYEPEDEELQISYPLIKCLQGLKEKHAAISRLHKERFEQVRSMARPFAIDGGNHMLTILQSLFKP